MNLNVQNTNILYIFHLLQDFYFINLMGYFCQHLFPVPQRQRDARSQKPDKKAKKWFMVVVVAFVVSFLE